MIEFFLSMKQLFFIAKESKTIKATSFFVNYERESNLLNYLQFSMLTKVAKNKIDIFKKVHENIFKMQQRFATYVNKKKKKSTFTKKEK